MSKNIVSRILFVIALVVAILSTVGCDGTAKLADVVKAQASGDVPATAQNLTYYYRIEKCGISDMSGIRGDMEKAVKQSPNITIDQFLDNEMPAHQCVSPKVQPTPTPVKK